MCYNNCVHERFNPVTGDCRCARLKGVPCPEDDELIMCPHCDCEFVDEGQDNCPECDATIQR